MGAYKEWGLGSSRKEEREAGGIAGRQAGRRLEAGYRGHLGCREQKVNKGQEDPPDRGCSSSSSSSSR